MALPGTGVITSEGVTRGFRGPTTTPLQRELDLYTLQQKTRKQTEFKRLEDHYREQYKTEASQFTDQSMSDDEFNNRINTLQTKYKMAFNQAKMKFETEAESESKSIQDIQNLTNRGLLNSNQALEAVRRARYGPEAEAAMYPREDPSEKLARLQYIDRMEQLGESAGGFSPETAELERKRLSLGHLPARGEKVVEPAERLGKLKLEQDRITTILGGDEVDQPFRYTKGGTERIPVYGTPYPLITEREPFYEIVDIEGTKPGQPWKYKRIKPDDPRFPLIQRSEQITREIQGLYAPPGSLMDTATRSTRINPPPPGGALADQTKALLQQKAEPQPEEEDLSQFSDEELMRIAGLR